MENFDCIVIGESPSGLWGARQLLAKGLRVFILPTGTSRVVQALPIKVASEFEVPERFWIDREQAPLQVITHDRRFRVFKNEESFRSEFQFNFGEPFSLTKSPPVEFLRGLCYWQRGWETGPLFPDDWPGVFNRLSETVYFDRSPGLVEQWMLNSLRKSGAVIATAEKLSQVFVDKNKVVGVQLSETSQMIPARSIWVNTHFDYVNGFLNEKLTIKSKPMGWMFQIRFECTTDFLPVGSTDRMVYVEADAPPLEIEQESAGKFLLKTMLPMDSSTLDRDFQWRLATRMLRVVEALFPDLSYNLKQVIPDLRDRDRASKVEFPLIYPFETIESIPSHLLCFGLDAGLGFQTPVQGLMVTNEEAFPRLGLWGGYEAIRRILELS